MTDEHRRPLLLDEGELESEDEAAGLGGRYGGAVLVSDPLGALNNVQPAPQRPFVELPPAYTASKWSNSRPMTDLLNSEAEDEAEDDATASGDGPDVPPPPDPFANLTEGPRTVMLNRTDGGYGFTVGGGQGRPVHVVGVTNNGPAAAKGLKSGDQILEINGDDVMQGSLVEVSNAIQSAAATLTMVVVPGNPNRVHANPWHAALMALEHGNDHALNQMELAIDPTQRPPDNLRTALCSCVCCPLVAFAAVWHSRAVHVAWDAGLFNRARAHAIMSRKLSSSAVLYGILIFVFYVFVQLGKDDAGNR